MFTVFTNLETSHINIECQICEIEISLLICCGNDASFEVI